MKTRKWPTALSTTLLLTLASSAFAEQIYYSPALEGRRVNCSATNLSGGTQGNTQILIIGVENNSLEGATFAAVPDGETRRVGHDDPDAFLRRCVVTIEFGEQGDWIGSFCAADTFTRGGVSRSQASACVPLVD